MTSSPTRIAARTALVLATLVTLVAPVAHAQKDTTKKAGATSDSVDWAAYQKSIEPAHRDSIPANAYAGWKQFELNCSRCHGEYGVGTSFAPALIVSLKEGGTIPDQAAFIQVVCAGRPEKGMPSWCQLGLEMNKIQDIYAYLKLRADGKVAAGRPALKSEG
jgi:mono/diheme cytochrome c family protein